MKYKYAFKSDKENIAKVLGRDVEISTKKAIEICAYIKGMQLKNCIALMEKVMRQEEAIPFRRFTEGAGHQKGKGAAKYPYKAAKQFLMLLKSLEANAQNKGLGQDLKIIHACSQKAAEPYHYGRKRRIKMKRTHVEIVAEETEAKRDAKKESKKEKQEKRVETESAKK
ncbi:50S ribosomal protein L22 [Candidatus Woesearchaeota archaeon]|nr:50S ribosomal protein L22 [Candidatus Woesearchaeota archaeon]